MFELIALALFQFATLTGNPTTTITPAQQASLETGGGAGGWGDGHMTSETGGGAGGWGDGHMTNETGGGAGGWGDGHLVTGGGAGGWGDGH
jgi:hypothetical protein